MARTPDLMVLTGSRLYGTSTAESDYDYRGVYVPTLQQLACLEQPPIISDVVGYDPTDCQIYPLGKFLSELYRGNAQFLEILFAPFDNVAILGSCGQILIEKRDLFISSKTLTSLRGFAFSELRRAQGLGLQIKFENKTDEEVCESFFGRFQVKGLDRDSIYDIVFADRDDDPRQIVPTTRKLGAKRKEQVLKYGIDLKSACNYLRLLNQGIELATTHKLTFPRPDNERTLYLKIKSGNISKTEVLEIGRVLETKLTELILTNPLPKPDFVAINRLYYSLIVSNLEK